MLKDEMLPVKARMPYVWHIAGRVERAAYELMQACEECDGSFDTVEAVRKAADALRSVGEDCSEHADSAAECARRSCDRLT
jgi:hypothetical protein